MKPRNREINIFNLSMLDVISGAMGAFLILMVVALPYYKKDTINLTKEISALAVKVEQQQAELKQKQSELEEKQKELERSVKFALLGIATHSQSFVVLVDMSASMQAYVEPMLKTLSRLLEPMNDANQVQIIGFQGGTNSPRMHYWQKSGMMAVMNQPEISSATTFTKALASQFDSETPTYPALLEALKYDTEAIVLLTDGSPNSDPDDIISEITRLNAGKKEIHTIALGDYLSDRKLAVFLQELASHNRGGFLGVSQ